MNHSTKDDQSVIQIGTNTFALASSASQSQIHAKTAGPSKQNTSDFHKHDFTTGFMSKNMKEQPYKTRRASNKQTSINKTKYI